MNFNVSDLGNLKAGDRVQVTLQGSAANVRLMDSSNYSNYKNGRRHTYFGGLITKSPVVLGVPNSGHWYVTVDMQGLRGTVRSSVKILPSALPAYREPSLSTVPSLVHKEQHNPYETVEDEKNMMFLFLTLPKIRKK